MLDQVAKVDPLNPDAMRYRLYIARQLQEGTEDAGVSEQDSFYVTELALNLREAAE